MFPQPPPPIGQVMLGGIADKSPRWSHWVPEEAPVQIYEWGSARIAVCGAECVPATGRYLADLQACPACDREYRGFSHRVRTRQ